VQTQARNESRATPHPSLPLKGGGEESEAAIVLPLKGAVEEASKAIALHPQRRLSLSKRWEGKEEPRRP
jgi:hypothetical protein